MALLELEGGASRGWRCSGVELLEGGTSRLVVYVDRLSTENLLITAKHRRNSVVINWLLRYDVKVIIK